MSTFQEDRAYSAHEVTRKNAYNQEGTANLSSQQPVAIGFVYQQPSQQSFNNPYVTQEAHNPSYKSTSHHISPNSTPYIHGNTQNGGSHRIEDGCVWSTSTRTYYTNIHTMRKFIIGIVGLFILITTIMIIVFILMTQR